MLNSVEYLGHYGSDETHALSAWTSTKRSLTPTKRKRIGKLLIETLMGSDPAHTSPFEKSALHFLVTTDIATHIHILKHRIGVSVNAESARYKELNDNKFYVPVDWPADLQEILATEVTRSNEAYHWFVKELESRGFTRSRAKESARFVRPYASQITQDVMFNFLSFMHFQHLRNDRHAQLEVREIAQAMLGLVQDLGVFKHSLEAFGWPGERVAAGAKPVQMPLFVFDH